MAGFDGTGGAGTSAATKVFSHLHIPHVSVLTAIVIQSAHTVQRSLAIDLPTIEAQLDYYSRCFDVQLLNLGILGSLENFEMVTRIFPDRRVVFDPIIASGDGSYFFLSPAEIETITTLIKYCFLITPNIPEAEAITRSRITSIAGMKKAAEKIVSLGAQNVLIKGGHLGADVCQDILLSGGHYYPVSSRITPFRIHGTGSFLNAAISAYLFGGEDLKSSVEKAHSLLIQAVDKVNPDHPVLDL